MSICADRIAETIDVFDFELTEVETTRTAAMITGASLLLDHSDRRCGWPGGQLPPRLTGIGQGDDFLRSPHPPRVPRTRAEDVPTGGNSLPSTRQEAGGASRSWSFRHSA